MSWLHTWSFVRLSDLKGTFDSGLDKSGLFLDTSPGGGVVQQLAMWDRELEQLEREEGRRMQGHSS